MNIRPKVLIASLFLLASGCEQQAGNRKDAKPGQVPANAPAVAAPPAQEPPKSPDPLASFKSVVAKTRDAVDGKTPVWFNPNSSDWKKFRLGAEDFKYDVTKTDSLVSPYTGVITFELPTILIAQGLDKAQVEGATGPGSRSNAVEDYWRVTYAFQDDRWALKAVEMQTVVRARLSEGERKFLDTGWKRPEKGFPAEVVVPMIEAAAR